MTLYRNIYTFRNLILFLITLNLPVLYLDGLVNHFIGFTRLQTMYFGVIIISISLYAIVMRTYFFSGEILLLIFTFCAFLASTFINQKLSSSAYNIQYFVRGPLLFWLVLHFILLKTSHNFQRWNMIVIFITVSASSLIHVTTGFGFVEKGGRLDTIYNGFLTDTNSATLSLILATILITHNKSMMFKTCVFAISAFVCGLIDSKSGILVCGVISYFGFRSFWV